MEWPSRLLCPPAPCEHHRLSTERGSAAREAGRARHRQSAHGHDPDPPRPHDRSRRRHPRRRHRSGRLAGGSQDSHQEDRSGIGMSGPRASGCAGERPQLGSGSLILRTSSLGVGSHLAARPPARHLHLRGVPGPHAPGAGHRPCAGLHSGAYLPVGAGRARGADVSRGRQWPPLSSSHSSRMGIRWVDGCRESTATGSAVLGPSTTDLPMGVGRSVDQVRGPCVGGSHGPC